MRHSDHEEHDREAQPVRRVDPQETALQVRSHSGPVLARKDGLHEGPVEEEAGDQEEDRDADVEAREEGAEIEPERLELRLPGEERDVVDEHPKRGDSPKAVEAGEPWRSAVGHDRARLHRRSGHEGEPYWARIGSVCSAVEADLRCCHLVMPTSSATAASITSAGSAVVR